jgi:ribose 5-phosphate isomerase B
MKVALASDHRGFDAKTRLMPWLKKQGHTTVDFGCEAPQNCDYPDFAAPAARAVASGQCDVAILLDGSGIGMSIVANKIAGVRAALVHDDVTAVRAREHNHCNVLCLGTDLLGESQVRNIAEIFLKTPYVQGRHDRRIDKIKKIEHEEHLTVAASTAQSSDGGSGGATAAAARPSSSARPSPSA